MLYSNNETTLPPQETSTKAKYTHKGFPQREVEIMIARVCAAPRRNTYVHTTVWKYRFIGYI